MDETRERELKGLADFLNFDFKRKAENDHGRNQAFLGSVASITGLTSETDWVDTAPFLQATVREELKNLIEPAATDSAVQNDLERLVETINGLGLALTWGVSPVKRAIDVLKIGRKGWVLTPQFADLKTPAEKLYSVIFMACMDGSISQLKQCKQCHRVFYPKRKGGNRKFCKDACTAAFYDAGAVKRQRKHRQRQRKEKSRLAKQAGGKHRKETKDEVRKRAGIKAFEQFLIKSEEPRPENDVAWSSHFRKIAGASSEARWNVVNQWVAAKKRGKIEAIWQQLPQAFKDSLNPLVPGKSSEATQ